MRRGAGEFEDRVYRGVWQSVTPQTEVTYRCAAVPWRDWVKCRFGENNPPITATILTCFLAEVKDQGWSYSRANAVRNFVQKENAALGFPERAKCATLAQFMLGYRRTVPAQKSRNPLHETDLEKFYLFLQGVEECEETRAKIVAMCALAYYGCLRMSEVKGINKTDFTFTNHGLQIWIRKSKNWPTGVATHLPFRDVQFPTPPTFFEAVRQMVGSDKISEKLFTDAQGKQTNAFIARCFPGTTKEFYSFHSWRHGRVSDVYTNLEGTHKSRLDLIANFGKWKCRSTVAIYLHVENRSKRGGRAQGNRKPGKNSGQIAM